MHQGICIKDDGTNEKGDCVALKRFVERVIQNNSFILETIESAEIPEREKEEAKSRLLDFKKLPGILKEKAKSFSVDVAKDVVVSLTAEEIEKLLVPVLSTAVFGVPIPSQIMTMLVAAIRN